MVALAQTAEGSLPPFGDPEHLCYVRRVPLGVCALVTPWNHPLLIATKKVAPALAVRRNARSDSRPGRDKPSSGFVDLRPDSRKGASKATPGAPLSLPPRNPFSPPDPPSAAGNAIVIKAPEIAPITVLECVMRQTSSYAPARPGRCSVFWGDQIFVPSCGIAASSAPADILTALRPMPTKAEW